MRNITYSYHKWFHMASSFLWAKHTGKYSNSLSGIKALVGGDVISNSKSLSAFAVLDLEKINKIKCTCKTPRTHHSFLLSQFGSRNLFQVSDNTMPSSFCCTVFSVCFFSVSLLGEYIVINVLLSGLAWYTENLSMPVLSQHRNSQSRSKQLFEIWVGSC